MTCNYFHAIIKPLKHIQLLAAETTEFAIEKDVYACCYCLRLRLGFRFADKMLKKKRNRYCVYKHLMGWLCPGRKRDYVLTKHKHQHHNFLSDYSQHLVLEHLIVIAGLEPDASVTCNAHRRQNAPIRTQSGKPSTFKFKVSQENLRIYRPELFSGSRLSLMCHRQIPFRMRKCAGISRRELGRYDLA